MNFLRDLWWKLRVKRQLRKERRTLDAWKRINAL